MKDLSIYWNRKVVIGMEKKEIKLILSGLTCANCANKIETRVNNLDGVKEANLNFTTSTLIIELDGSKEENAMFNTEPVKAELKMSKYAFWTFADPT